MKIPAALLLTSFIFAPSGPAFGGGGALLILHFRTDRAFAAIVRAPHITRANAEFNAWVEAMNAEIAADQREILRLRRALADAREEDRAGIEAELFEREKAFEEKFARHGNDIAARRLAVRDAIEDQMLFLVHELAEERGAALVLEKRDSLLLYDSTHDITDEVARRYAERFDTLESPYADGKLPRPLEETPLTIPGFEPYRPPVVVRLPPLPATPDEKAEEVPPPDSPLSAGLLALGRRMLLVQNDAAKAMRIWREATERAGSPLWGVAAGVACDDAALAGMVEAAEGNFALPEGGEGCARVFRAAFRDEMEAARAAAALGGEARKIK